MVSKEDIKQVMFMENITIAMQKAYIEELEKQVDYLQKALDTVLLNKCRTRKVKVKIYGRSPMDKNLHRYV